MKHSNDYANGNIRFEMVGDSSDLFEPEDFQKVEVKPLRSEKPEDQNSNYYPDGNVKVEVVGDTSHLFEPEDFQKVEVKPLKDSESITKSTEVDEIQNKNQDNFTNSSDKSKTTIDCNLKNLENYTDLYENKVLLVNGTTLTRMLAESKVNDCFIVMFYVPWCPFSAHLASYYNALPRAFNQLDILAFDVSKSTG